MKKINEAAKNLKTAEDSIAEAQSILASIADRILTKEEILTLEESVWSLTMKISKIQVQESDFRSIRNKVDSINKIVVLCGAG